MNFQIGTRSVGPDFPPLVVAEIGINHNGDLEVAKKLIVAHLNPKEWTRIIAPKQVILRASVNDDGSMGDIQQMDSDQHLQWLGWQDILNSLKPEGISDRHILNMCKAKPHVITTFCRVRFECDRALNIPEETALDVEVTIDA